MSKPKIIIPVIVLGVAGLLFFVINVWWTTWSGSRTEQETDDAYLTADMTPLTTRVSGKVRKLDVEDYQPVKAGQLVVEIDEDEYRAVVEQAKAALAASEAALADNQVAKQIQKAKIQTAEAMVSQAKAAVSAARAGVAAMQPEVDRTALEAQRQEALLASKATTRQQLQSAVADAGRYSGMLAGSQADLERAQAELASSQAQLEAEKSQLA